MRQTDAGQFVWTLSVFDSETLWYKDSIYGITAAMYLYFKYPGVLNKY